MLFILLVFFGFVFFRIDRSVCFIFFLFMLLVVWCRIFMISGWIFEIKVLLVGVFDKYWYWEGSCLRLCYLLIWIRVLYKVIIVVINLLLILIFFWWVWFLLCWFCFVIIGLLSWNKLCLNFFKVGLLYIVDK